MLTTSERVAGVPRRTSATRVAAATAFAAAYLLSIKLAEGAYGSLAVPSPFWLPDSVLLCALLITPRREWWFWIALMWPLRLAAGVVPGTPLWFQLLAVANDSAKAVCAAWLLHKILRRTVRLSTLKEFLVFLVVAAAAVPLLSALAAGAARHGLGDEAWGATYRWFLGNCVTQVVVTPALLYWCHREYRHPNARLGELLVLLTGLAIVSSYTFVLASSALPSMLIYSPVPFLVWAAIRLRPFGTANAIAVVAVVSMVSAVRANGVFAPEGMMHSVLSLQLFLLVIGVCLLSLSTLIDERRILLQQEMEFSQQLLDTQQQERARIARELHDDFGQRLALLSMDLDQLSSAADVAGPARDRLSVSAQHVRALASDLHRLSHRLHPSALEVVGLEAALKQLCTEVADRHRLSVDFTSRDVPPQLEQEISVALFRIAQEALQNVVRHSHAADAAVELATGSDGLVLVVSDSGSGFETNDLWELGGLGLASMRERVRPFDGSVTVASSPTRGTTVRAEIPVIPSLRG
jgi:signal transduction histidine kinase